VRTVQAIQQPDSSYDASTASVTAAAPLACNVLQIRSIERQRVGMYRQMRQLRQELHAMVLQQHSQLAATVGAAAQDHSQQQRQTAGVLVADAQDQSQQQGVRQGRQSSQEQQQRETAKRVMLLLGGVDDVVSDAAAAAVGHFCSSESVASAPQLESGIMASQPLRHSPPPQHLASM
jgi:hypothetical protein